MAGSVKVTGIRLETLTVADGGEVGVTGIRNNVLLAAEYGEVGVTGIRLMTLVSEDYSNPSGPATDGIFLLNLPLPS